LRKQTQRQRFESLMLPHLNAAYNLARWIMGNEQDAQDVVQEAFLKAFKGFERYREGNSAGWLLTIVRNACYTCLKRDRDGSEVDMFDEDRHSMQTKCVAGQTDQRPANPEALLLAAAEGAQLQAAVARLPIEFREVLVLREIEGCSYREIADIVGIPSGTVMSRLSRARHQLQHILEHSLSEVPPSEL